MPGMQVVPDTQGRGVSAAMIQLGSMEEAAAALQALNGQIVEVRGPAPGGTGRIATAMIGGEVEVALKPENIVRQNS